MYKCGSPKVIFDPYEVCSYGEGSIRLHYDEKLTLEMDYHDKEKGEEKKLTIEFEFPAFHRFSSFPGIDTMQIEYEDIGPMGPLVELTRSELSDAWEKYFNDEWNLPPDRRIKFSHYIWFFLNENERLDVVCESVRILK